MSERTEPDLPATVMKSPIWNGRRTPRSIDAMKFSAMSRNANPRARPTTPASPRTETTAWVRFSTERPSRMPASTIRVLRIDPTTERSSEFGINGERSGSDVPAEEPGQEAERQRRSRPPGSPGAISSDEVAVFAQHLSRHLPAGEDLGVGLHLVEDEPDPLDLLGEGGDVVERVIVVDVPFELHGALVDVDVDGVDARELAEEVFQGRLDRLVVDLLADLDRPGRRGEHGARVSLAGTGDLLGSALGAWAGLEGAGRPGSCAEAGGLAIDAIPSVRARIAAIFEVGCPFPIIIVFIISRA